MNMILTFEDYLKSDEEITNKDWDQTVHDLELACAVYSLLQIQPVPKLNQLLKEEFFLTFLENPTHTGEESEDIWKLFRLNWYLRHSFFNIEPAKFWGLFYDKIQVVQRTYEHFNIKSVALGLVIHDRINADANQGETND